MLQNIVFENEFREKDTMYEPYTRQALPDRHYRELIGSALCVFNSNNAFIIENILRNDLSGTRSWHGLIDKQSGNLKPEIRNTKNVPMGPGPIGTMSSPPLSFSAWLRPVLRHNLSGYTAVLRPPFLFSQVSECLSCKLSSMQDSVRHVQRRTSARS